MSVLLYLLDANETHGKAKWELLKNTTCFLNKSWKQPSTKQQLYGQLLPIS